jgi:hypothetical protein
MSEASRTVALGSLPAPHGGLTPTDVDTVNTSSRPSRPLVVGLAALVLATGGRDARSGPSTQYSRETISLPRTRSPREIRFPELDRALEGDRWPRPGDDVASIKDPGPSEAGTPLEKAKGAWTPAAILSSRSLAPTSGPSPTIIIASVVLGLFSAGVLTLSLIELRRQRRERRAKALVRSVIGYDGPDAG